MTMDRIDRDGADPPWMQLRDILRRQIEGGELTGRLPSAGTLGQRYDLAEGTVTKALYDLRDQGLIVIHKGWGASVVPRSTPPG
jgi:DNA-binding GntR family transcriptional regulator